MKNEQTFWSWFQFNEEAIFNVGTNQDELFDEIGRSLQEVSPNLTFELGPPLPSRDFIISADGIKDLFPVVKSLVAAAPKLRRWNVIAFRPRRILPCVVELGAKKIDSEDVKFSLLDDGKVVGIRLFIPGFRESDTGWKQVGYLLLDEALGEYDVESSLGLIKMYAPEVSTQEKRYSLSQLPNAFDALVERLADKNKTVL
jgi:hypothetical protein